MGDVGELLRSTSWEVRCDVLHELCGLEPVALIENATAVVECLRDEHFQVRTAALQVLRHFEPGPLAENAVAVAQCLQDEDVSVRVAALETLRRLDSIVLVEHADALTQCLHIDDRSVRCLTRNVLADHMVIIFQCLRDPDEHVKRVAQKAFSSLEQTVFAEYATDMVASPDRDPDGQHAALLCTMGKLLSGPRPQTLLNMRDSDGDSLLHVAARHGDVASCRRLFNAGAVLKARNSKGQTPEDVALQGSRGEAASYLQSVRNISTIRGGTGGAMSEAKLDRRRIIHVDWHSIELPGFVGTLGGLHSLLAITVGDGCGTSTFVIEKAAQVRISQDGDNIQPNGVLVSHWADVAPNVDGNVLHTLTIEELRSNVRMAALINTAVSLGEYDVGSCNCHDAALAVYNMCALPDSRLSGVPNEFLTAAARTLNRFGINVANSRGSASNSGPVYSHVAVSEPLYDNGVFATPHLFTDDHLVAQAPSAARLSAWIYFPGIGGGLTFSNDAHETIEVHVEETEETFSISAGAVAETNFGDNDCAHVCIKRKGVGSILGRRLGYLVDDTLRRPRVEMLRQRCVPGSYKIILDADRNAVCLPQSMLPEGLHVRRDDIELTADGHILQWAVVLANSVCYVVFEGTAQALDMLVNLSCLTCDAHGLEVHSGMWLAFRQRGRDIIGNIAEKLRLHQQASATQLSVVLCGHSLGGGYAILAGLALLARGIDVAAVVTFGAPSVVVPDITNDLWRQLDEKVTAYINAYDLVPRLPSCDNWIFDAVPKSGVLGACLGPLELGMDPSQKLKETLGQQLDVLKSYDIIGRVIFVDKGSSGCRVLRWKADRSHRCVLEGVPSPLGKFILEQHSMSEYVAILERLSSAVQV